MQALLYIHKISKQSTFKDIQSANFKNIPSFLQPEEKIRKVGKNYNQISKIPKKLSKKLNE